MKRSLLFLGCIFISVFAPAQNGILVFQTDFGLKDGAVAAMKGVAMKVSSSLKIFDLTHEIPAFDVWQAAYRLAQTAGYWPQGTVFVSVVDPGVGGERRSIVLRTKSGHFFVTPDNGTLTLISSALGIDEVRLINEKLNRLPGSGESYTFHGRDVFAYTGARLAAKKISFEQVGAKFTGKLVLIDYQPPVVENNTIKGSIPVLDIQYGNVWTNIPGQMLKKIGVTQGDTVLVKIFENEVEKFSGSMPFVKTFSQVPQKNNLLYSNSLLNLSIAINVGNFAKEYEIQSGPEWRIEIQKQGSRRFAD